MYNTNMTVLYVLSSGNARLLSFLNGSSVGTVIFGTSTGSALNQLNQAHSFAMDTQESFYIADTLNHRILKWWIGASNAIVIAGVTNSSGSSTSHLYRPTDVILDEANEYMYVSDFGNHRVLRFRFNSNQWHRRSRWQWARNRKKARLLPKSEPYFRHRFSSYFSQLNGPLGIYLYKKTNALYIGDQNNSRIQRWYLGEVQGVTIAGSPNGVQTGTDPWTLRTVNNVAVTEDGTRLCVSDRSNHRIQMFRLI